MKKRIAIDGNMVRREMAREDDWKELVLLRLRDISVKDVWMKGFDKILDYKP